MNRFLYLFSIFFIFTVISVSAQDREGRRGEMAPELRRQALVIDIESRVLGAEQAVVWSEINSKEAIPGSPVGVQLQGSNLILSVQFTPFVRRDVNVLVAHCQIWIANPDNTVTGYTSIQTIPMEFGEKIHFFPLGSSDKINPSIEIIITVTSNRDGGGPRRTNVGNER